MTNIETITIDHTDGAPLAPDDVRVALARAVQTARGVIARIDGANAERATPCAPWTVGDLGRHLVGVFHRVAAAPSGADLLAFPLLADIDIAHVAAEFDRAVGASHVAWSDDATLGQMIDAPFGTLPGAVVLGIWATEPLVHTRDLAVAMGVEPTWPMPDVEMSLAATMAEMPPTGRPAEVPFADRVDIADDAPAIDRLAAYLGRDVSAWRSRTTSSPTTKLNRSESSKPSGSSCALR